MGLLAWALSFKSGLSKDLPKTSKASRIAEERVLIQAVEMSEGNSSSESQIEKLNSKRKKLKTVSWALVICFKRQVMTFQECSCNCI